MPLWLDLLRTPMAAPETRFLRAMRHVWQGLYLALATTILLLDPLKQLLGSRASLLIAGLMLLTATHSLIYLRVKNRADTEWLTQAGEGE
ncbi:hypothetical protein A0J57_19485 [Sphingobium sp. 22B]|nr:MULTISPECIES: hypothetical protein [Sphingobium]KXU30864.1 hypothetical protein AXW74_15715 [Sphingobium sp. AM]KYC30690.1 hypothetical protein A0J57_19485 [Sphingobium sp. 22B]MCB4858990.1 hypothetical protein [Sphingobium sp. PNB]OAP30377.1 hypothetical protein A8O16_18790 [Sphingobium sp. 20006FA]KKW89378.1 hypothetical protein YP76_25825 [Sphingobium chungbukense]